MQESRAMMKRACRYVVVRMVWFLLGVVPWTPTAAMAVCDGVTGDLDGDEDITITDLYLFNLYAYTTALEIPAGVNMACGDVDCDQELTPNDSWLIFQALLGVGEELSCEWIFFEKTGDGSGAILVNGSVICDATCTDTQVAYTEGETLTIAAQPSAGSTFDGWLINGEAVSGAATIEAGDTVTAIFSLIPAPTADFTAAPRRGYAPLTVTFRSTSQGEIDTLTWDFGNGQTSQDISPTSLYATPGTYSVSLTADGPGGSDTLTQTDLIDVLVDNQPPVITIDSPASGAVVAAGEVTVSGTVTDDGTLAEVLVNEVAATVSGDAAGGYTFTATMTLESGNQMLHVSAEDGGGEFGFGERLLQVDGDGPEITITAPQPGTAVDSLIPSIEIAFSDFLSAVDDASVQVTLAEDGGASTDITADLTVTTTGADGTLSTALTAESSYTLDVSVSDSLGNLSTQRGRFYVPVDPDSLVAPDEPEDAGWIVGTVYDSSTCNEHLSICTGLAGARVTVAYAGEDGEAVAGTIVTGPEGDFRFPVSETNIYWIRVEKDEYSYGQREVEVVRERATVTSDIYLTPLDTAVSECDSSGCSHESADGLMQIEVPAGAIADGQTVEVRATNFSHVAFLPSGELPPGTAETYAFALGNDLVQARVDFLTPVTVKQRNYRNFDPGEQIPLGWWNPETMSWEHAGVGEVDASGDWLVMEVEHFSYYDCNDPMVLPEAPTEETDQTGGDPVPCTPPDCFACGTETGKCTIDTKSGVFQESYRLPPVQALGRDAAPQLLYSSRRALPSTVIDLSLTMQAFEDPDAQVGDDITFELFLEGKKRDRVTSAFQIGQEYRFRTLWEGRGPDGEWGVPGIYGYRATVSVPYRAQYYYAKNYRFGGPPDYEYGATGRYGNTKMISEFTGTVALDSQADSPFGTGWVLGGQQRLYADEAGRILIADGRSSSEFYDPANNLLRQARRGLSERLVWTNAGSDTIQSLKTSTGLTDTIDVGNNPLGLALSSDGTTAYVALEGSGDGESLAVVNVEMSQLFGTVATDLQPANVVLSPDGRYAYIVHWGSKTLQVVNTATRQTVDTMLVEAGADGWHDLAVSPDGRYAYLVGRYYSNSVAVVDLAARELVMTIQSGEQPSDIVLSPDGATAYVTNETGNSVSMLDLVSLTKQAEIAVGSAPRGIALSPDAAAAYVTNSGSSSVSVVDLETLSVTATIAVGSQPHGIVVTEDGAIAYVANHGENTISAVDLETRALIDIIATGSQPTAVALTVAAEPGIYAVTGSDESTLEYDGSTYTRVYPNGTRVHFDAQDRHDYTVDRLGNTTSYTYNTDGTTATMNITPAGSSNPVWTWTFAYTDGTLDTITDPAGRITHFTIDGKNHFTSAALELPSWEGSGVGPTRTFAYDSRGLMTQESDEAGNMSTHVYDDYGRVTSTHSTLRAANSAGSTSAASETTRFTTVDTGYPLLNDLGFSDPDSPAPALPASDELIARVEYDRGSIEGTMDTWGRWLTKTDAEGNTTTFERDSAGHLTQQTDPDGSCTVYQVDLLGNILAKARMEADQCALDPADRDSAQMQITAYTYEDSFYRVKTVTDPNGYVTTYIYDYEEDAGDSGNLIRIEYPKVEDENGDLVTPTVSYSYNAAGQVTSMTDEAGTVTRYVYTSGTEDEAYGGANALFQEGVTPVPELLTQLIEDEDGVAQTTTYSDFDALGNPGTVTGPGCCGGGEVTYYTYDDLGRVLTKTDALSIVTTYAYDANGNVSQTIADYTEDGTTGRNIVTIYTYDAKGNLLNARTEADGLLRETSYSYDENGKLATMTNPNGHTTTYSYDDADQLVSVTDALGQTTSYSYTANGELETVTLPNGTIMKYVYNGLGQKMQQIEDLGGLSLVTDYTYYPDGNLHTVTDAEQHTTTYSYDALDRVTAVVDTLSQTTSYAYDSAGNLRSLTDAEQQASGFAYNGLGQLEQESRPMGENTSYTYTASGKLETKTDANNQRTEYVYEAGTNLLTDIYYFDSSDTQTGHVSFTYERGQLSGYDDGTVSATYAYNAFGQKLSETVNYPDFSKTFSYTYDNNGQKRYFSMPDGTTYSYTYNDNNELEDIRIPGVGNISYPSYTLGLPDSMSSPGDTRSYAYDALARLEDLDSSTLDYSYSYDDVGNILTKTTEHGSYVYDYDDVYRLTDVDNPTLDDEAYTYDGVGNRETASGVSGAITHNANNELEVYGDITYDYDANGNMVSKTSASESWAYTYNVQNRLVQVEEDDLLIAEYGYDPFGRRLWKEVDGTRTYFFYADEGLVAEYDVSGTEIRSYGYQPDSVWTTNPVFLKEGGSYYWYQNDHVGTPQKLVDVNGTVVWSAQYTAFGKADVQIETVTNNLRFPGQYADTETGLHYNWFRYYEPGNGRYLRTDPIGFLGGDVNLYAYVLNNPGMFGDPDGLTLTGAGIGAAIGAVIGGTVGGVVGVVGGSAVGTFVVPGVGTIGGGVVGGSEGVASGAAAGAVVGGMVGGWIGHRISDGCDPDAIPQDKAKPIPVPLPKPLEKPKKRRGGWTCTCRADCDHLYVNNPCLKKPLEEQSQVATAFAATITAARREAKALATKQLGGKPKHQPCLCVGPKGEVVYTPR